MVILFGIRVSRPHSQIAAYLKVYTPIYSPVIPQCARVRRPPKPNLDVDVPLVHVVEVVEDHVALGAVEADDAVRHGAVDPQGLPPRGRVHADERVHALDVLEAGLGAVAVEVRVRGPVHGQLAVDDPAEVRRQLLVRRVPARPQRVAAHRRHRVVVQVRDPRRLQLVHEVRVPPRRASRVAEVGDALGGLEVRPDHRNAELPRDLWYLRLCLEVSIHGNAI